MRFERPVTLVQFLHDNAHRFYGYTVKLYDRGAVFLGSFKLNDFTADRPPCSLCGVYAAFNLRSDGMNPGTLEIILTTGDHL